MATHPVLAAALFATAAFFSLGAAFFACAIWATREVRLKVAFAVLCLVTAVIVTVVATAGTVLL